MRRLILVCLLAAIGLLTAAAGLPVAAADANAGTINGSLAYRTAGGTSSLGGLPVVLSSVKADGSLVKVSTVSTDASGKFQFTGLGVDGSAQYRAEVTFQGVVYGADAAVLTAAAPVQSVSVPVYDTTTKDDVIRISMAHLLVFADSGVLTVQEIYVFTNSGDRTYVGPQTPGGTAHPGTVTMSLPAQATQLEADPDLQSFNLTANEAVLVDTAPVLPGDTQFLFGYRLPLSGGSAVVNKRLYYATDNYRLLVQGTAISVVAPDLQLQAPVQTQGMQFTYYLGKGLARGTSLSITMATTTGAGQLPFVWIGAGIAVAALAAVLVFLLRRRRAHHPVATALAGDGLPETLVREIAGLDDDFAAGKVGEADYRRQREAKKAALRRLLSGDGGGKRGDG